MLMERLDYIFGDMEINATGYEIEHVIENAFLKKNADYLKRCNIAEGLEYHFDFNILLKFGDDILANVFGKHSHERAEIDNTIFIGVTYYDKIVFTQPDKTKITYSLKKKFVTVF